MRITLSYAGLQPDNCIALFSPPPEDGAPIKHFPIKYFSSKTEKHTINVFLNNLRSFTFTPH